jgi:hypothetical protein
LNGGISLDLTHIPTAANTEGDCSIGEAGVNPVAVNVPAADVMTGWLSAALQSPAAPFSNPI